MTGHTHELLLDQGLRWNWKRAPESDSQIKSRVVNRAVISPRSARKLWEGGGAMVSSSWREADTGRCRPGPGGVPVTTWFRQRQCDTRHRHEAIAVLAGADQIGGGVTGHWVRAKGSPLAPYQIPTRRVGRRAVVVVGWWVRSVACGRRSSTCRTVRCRYGNKENTEME